MTQRLEVTDEMLRAMADPAFSGEEDGDFSTALHHAVAVELLNLRAENARLREFVEAMVTPCEWGPSAFVNEDEADLSDVAMRLGLLVEHPHAQPCEVEGCECDGSPTLLHFAWKPPLTPEGGTNG